MPKVERIVVAEARAVAEEALSAAGAPPRNAELQVDLLIEGELRGHPSHGLLRLPRLVRRIRSGVLDPCAVGELDWTAPGRLEVDGRDGFGAVVADTALTAITERARSTGISTALVHGANHLGMLACYADRVASAGQVLIATTTSEALVHPWGGRRAMVGTNPLAIGVPTGDAPLIFDMATGVVSMGKIHAYAAEGRPLDEGWALDAEGLPTTDARVATLGSIAPFGGAKGYGLGIALEALIGALTSSALGPDVVGTLDDDRVCNKGDVFIVIEASADAGGALAGYLEAVRESPATDLDLPVRVPGDGAAARRAKSLAGGLTIPAALWAEIRSLAQADDPAEGGSGR